MKHTTSRVCVGLNASDLMGKHVRGPGDLRPSQTGAPRKPGDHVTTAPDSPWREQSRGPGTSRVQNGGIANGNGRGKNAPRPRRGLRVRPSSLIARPSCSSLPLRLTAAAQSSETKPAAD